MIGRGTRLCRDLSCIDAIDGEYTDKRRFLIFDYCGNFEFFGQQPNGYESSETRSLSENIFCRQVSLIAALQNENYADEKYQSFRSELVKLCYNDVCRLSYDLVSVRLQREYVEKYRQKDSFRFLSETEVFELQKHISPLITIYDPDESAKRFDLFMYGLMLSIIERSAKINYFRKQLILTAIQLEKKTTIPQVKEKLPLIREVQTEEFWQETDILMIEKVRKELRSLIQFLVGQGHRTVYTDLKDPVIKTSEGVELLISVNMVILHSDCW